MQEMESVSGHSPDREPMQTEAPVQSPSMPVNNNIDVAPQKVRRRRQKSVTNEVQRERFRLEDTRPYMHAFVHLFPQLMLHLPFLLGANNLDTGGTNWSWLDTRHCLLEIFGLLFDKSRGLVQVESRAPGVPWHLTFRDFQLDMFNLLKHMLDELGVAFKDNAGIEREFTVDDMKWICDNTRGSCYTWNKEFFVNNKLNVAGVRLPLTRASLLAAVGGCPATFSGATILQTFTTALDGLLNKEGPSGSEGTPADIKAASLEVKAEKRAAEAAKKAGRMAEKEGHLRAAKAAAARGDALLQRRYEELQAEMRAAGDAPQQAPQPAASASAAAAAAAPVQMPAVSSGGGAAAAAGTSGGGVDAAAEAAAAEVFALHFAEATAPMPGAQVPQEQCGMQYDPSLLQYNWPHGAGLAGQPAAVATYGLAGGASAQAAHPAAAAVAASGYDAATPGGGVAAPGAAAMDTLLLLPPSVSLPPAPPPPAPAAALQQRVATRRGSRSRANGARGGQSAAGKGASLARSTSTIEQPGQEQYGVQYNLPPLQHAYAQQQPGGAAAAPAVMTPAAAAAAIPAAVFWGVAAGGGAQPGGGRGGGGGCGGGGGGVEEVESKEDVKTPRPSSRKQDEAADSPPPKRPRFSPVKLEAEEVRRGVSRGPRPRGGAPRAAAAAGSPGSGTRSRRLMIKNGPGAAGSGSALGALPADGGAGRAAAAAAAGGGGGDAWAAAPDAAAPAAAYLAAAEPYPAPAFAVEPKTEDAASPAPTEPGSGPSPLLLGPAATASPFSSAVAAAPAPAEHEEGPEGPQADAYGELPPTPADPLDQILEALAQQPPPSDDLQHMYKVLTGLLLRQVQGRERKLQALLQRCGREKKKLEQLASLLDAHEQALACQRERALEESTDLLLCSGQGQRELEERLAPAAAQLKAAHDQQWQQLLQRQRAEWLEVVQEGQRQEEEGERAWEQGLQRVASDPQAQPLALAHTCPGAATAMAPAAAPAAAGTSDGYSCGQQLAVWRSGDLEATLADGMTKCGSMDFDASLGRV